MLSGEGNENCKRKKNNNRSNQKKGNFARAAHFFCTFLCLVLHSYTFSEEMSYLFSFTLFSTAAHFHLALVDASISHVVTAATKFSCCSSNKKNVFLLLYIPNLWA